MWFGEESSGEAASVCYDSLTSLSASPNVFPVQELVLALVCSGKFEQQHGSHQGPVILCEVPFPGCT